MAGALQLADLRTQVQIVERLQARTEALIDSSPVGMAVIDPGGVVRHWNAALEQILGVPRADALAQPFADVLPVSLRAVVREFLRQCPLPTRSRAYRIRVGGRDREQLVEVSAAPLKAAEGPESLLLTIDDVTDRVRLEEQLIQQDRLASVGLLAAANHTDLLHEVPSLTTAVR